MLIPNSLKKIVDSKLAELSKGLEQNFEVDSSQLRWIWNSYNFFR